MFAALCGEAARAVRGTFVVYATDNEDVNSCGVCAQKFQKLVIILLCSLQHLYFTKGVTSPIVSQVFTGRSVIDRGAAMTRYR